MLNYNTELDKMSSIKLIKEILLIALFRTRYDVSVSNHKINIIKFHNDTNGNGQKFTIHIECMRNSAILLN